MDALSAETVVCRMSLALGDCPDLSIRDSRHWAYRKHNISEEYISQFDTSAKRNEEMRRRLWPQKTRTIGGILARLTAASIAVASFYSLWVATPAWAASETIATADNWSSLFITAGAWVGGTFLALYAAFLFAAWLIYPNVAEWEPDYRDDRDALARDREGGIL